MRIVSGREAADLVTRLAARGSELASVEPRVRRIVSDVRRSGDRALRRYAKRWDGLGSNRDLRVSEAELSDAWDSVGSPLRGALRKAARSEEHTSELQSQ